MTEQQKPKQKIDPQALIAKLSKEGNTLLEHEIIAPLLPGGRICTRLGGMIYEFKPRGKFVGWGRFRPVNEREAELLGEAMPWERGGYLELFPVLRVILLWPDTHSKYPGTWLALPYNDSDAHQRFGFSTEPLPVFLCDPTNGAERFERILVRVDSTTLWFDGPDTLADPTHAEWLRNAATNPDTMERFLPGLASSERSALLFWQIRQIELALEPELRTQAQADLKRQLTEHRQNRQMQQELLRLSRQEQQERLRQTILRSRLEESLRHALAKADATLHSFSEIPTLDGSPGHLVVEWSGQGQTRRYRSTLDPRLTVVSSGICLSDRDRDFDLTSLVSVMTNAPF